MPLLARRVEVPASIASISGATASHAGDARSGAFRSAGTGDASASRTVRRCTPYSGHRPDPHPRPVISPDLREQHHLVPVPSAPQ